MGLLAIITNGLMGVNEIKNIRIIYPFTANIKLKKVNLGIMNIKQKNQLNLNMIKKSLKLETKKPKVILKQLKKKLIWK